MCGKETQQNIILLVPALEGASLREWQTTVREHAGVCGRRRFGWGCWSTLVTMCP